MEKLYKTNNSPINKIIQYKFKEKKFFFLQYKREKRIINKYFLKYNKKFIMNMINKFIFNFFIFDTN